MDDVSIFEVLDLMGYDTGGRPCHNVSKTGKFKCSECGFLIRALAFPDGTIAEDPTPNFCPSCGAKVVEE